MSDENDLKRWRYEKGKAIRVKAYLSPEGSRSYN